MARALTAGDPSLSVSSEQADAVLHPVLICLKQEQQEMVLQLGRYLLIQNSRYCMQMASGKLLYASGTEWHVDESNLQLLAFEAPIVVI